MFTILGGNLLGRDSPEIKKLRKEVLQIFFDKILQFMKDHPGILQDDLKKGFFKYEEYLSTFLSLLEEKGFIRKVKTKGYPYSYKLYLDVDLAKDDFLKEWEEIDETNIGYVSTSNYRDCFDAIIEYFGEDLLKKLYNHRYDLNFDYEAIHPSHHFRKLSQNKQLVMFLFRALEEGACVRFEMNDPLRKVIDNYWTEECNIELKKFLLKYGFFADKAFINLRLGEILGEKGMYKFISELKRKSCSFRIKWCFKPRHFGWSYGLGLENKLQPEDIPRYYAESLKYKWGLKPNIEVKKCKYCGKKFIPILPDLKSNKIENVIKFYPIRESINEINFCARHFPPQEFYNEDSIYFFKKLTDLIGFTPPTTFHEDYNYLKDFDKKTFEEAVIILNHIPGFKRIGVDTSASFEEAYGSWINVLIEANILKKDGILKTPRGYMCLAEDGHLCRSLNEKNIDDWLYSNGIPHEREVRYPGSRTFRADWKVGEYFIEFWGLKGQEDYDEKMEIKKKLAQKHGIPLINIAPMELPFLNSKLKKLKDEYGGKELPTYELKPLKRKEERDEILIELDEHTLKLMKIPGMGYTKIKRLNEAGIHSLDDIRNCSFESLLSTEGLGDKLIKRLLSMVGREEECYLFELKKIPMVWNETLIKLSKAGITSIGQLSGYTVEELIRTAGIGIGCARKIEEYIGSINNKRGFKKKG